MSATMTSNSPPVLIPLDASEGKIDQSLPELLFLNTNYTEDEYRAFCGKLDKARRRYKMEVMGGSALLLLSTLSAGAVLAYCNLFLALLFLWIIPSLMYVFCKRQRFQKLQERRGEICALESTHDPHVAFCLVDVTKSSKIFDGAARALRETKEIEWFVKIMISDCPPKEAEENV